ncbi:hypothetical protein Pflav_008980 [Phytohabitans flavus]|uniref:DUF2637 domain-containing protein n=1 Tax=Phytohabitans flavus TaxID=1076124 RepID=A0A6F8XL19_9ACTN|nr:hypothetical protein [Phytohabitans flavus]BCB74488.1 hypothetical protein Pflav_008980 [Phytohabitans flavus]
MTSTPVHQPPAGPDRPVTAGGVDLDADLQLALRRTSLMRQCFYIVVLVVALAGQVSGAVQALHIPVGWAIPAVVSLELGGVVVLANADVRRRLGERAAASRLLSALIAAWAVAFNWLAHDDRLLGGFFAGMSALGYLVWLTHAENQRRDRLRATGDLPPTTPAYELLGHWIRHPWLTLRAKSIAKANPRLGLYGSLSAARHEVRRERRQRSISRVLHRKIRSTVDPATADIALAVYDLDEIAVRLARQADYDTLTALIAADLAPARLAPAAAPTDLDLRPGEQNGPLPKIVAAAAAAGAAADPAPEPAAVPAPPVTAVQPPASGVPSGAPPWLRTDQTCRPTTGRRQRCTSRAATRTRPCTRHGARAWRPARNRPAPTWPARPGVSTMPPGLAAARPAATEKHTPKPATLPDPRTSQPPTIRHRLPQLHRTAQRNPSWTTGTG